MVSQGDETKVCDNVAPTPIVLADNTKEETTNGASYWDAPTEQELNGKTLSTMDLSSLRHQHEVCSEKERETEAQKESLTQSTGGYWDWKETLQRTLSKLTFKDMISQNTIDNQHSEPALLMQRKSSGSALKEDSNTDDGNASDQEASKSTEQGGASYWFWRNISLTNLSSASLTSLQNAAKSSEKQDDQATAEPCKPKPSYWFWRNASMSNISDDGNLEAMEKTARESDRMEGKQALTGPLTNLQHHMRTTWRKSFQRMSGSSLSQLNEAGEKTGEHMMAGADMQDSRSELPVPQEEDEVVEGAITF